MGHSNRISHRHHHAGFTLIEVMIVVAIIGILTSVAYPSYTEYVRRGQVQEAFGQLSAFRNKMEQYYQDNRNYGTGTTCATDASANAWNGFAATEYFTFSCQTNNSNQGYTITATGQSGATGYVYTINENGDRRTTKFKNATLNPVANCWLSKGATC